jgi:hypothetical protein
MRLRYSLWGIATGRPDPIVVEVRSSGGQLSATASGRGDFRAGSRVQPVKPAVI